MSYCIAPILQFHIHCNEVGFPTLIWEVRSLVAMHCLFSWIEETFTATTCRSKTTSCFSCCISVNACYPIESNACSFLFQLMPHTLVPLSSCDEAKALFFSVFMRSYAHLSFLFIPVTLLSPFSFPFFLSTS